MKKIKFGFSLAELLIAMAIVSIVAVMAMGIAQKGMERAYNIYYYTGYNALFTALADAISEENYMLGGDLVNRSTQEFLSHIATDSFDDANCKDENDTGSFACTIKSIGSNSVVEIKVSNGIIYSFSYLGSLTNICGTGFDSLGYIINMTIPAQRKKTANNGIVVGNTVNFLYLPKFEGGLLIPLNPDVVPVIRPVSMALGDTTDAVNIQNRVDLLSFYLDGGSFGRVGKVVYVWNENTGVIDDNPQDFIPRRFVPFREAFCTKYGSLVYNGTNYVDCSTPTVITKSTETSVTSTAIQYEDPRKAL